MIPQRWLILIVLNAGYFLVYFHRVSTGVLAPSLMEAFAAGAAGLGGMSSAYFYPYALGQPVAGILADRWGARKVVTLFTLIGSAGALLFAVAPTLLAASAGRTLIGLGAAGIFVPALKVLLPWFGRGSLGRMNATLVAVGNTGAIVSSAPYILLIHQVGWRISFVLIAALSLLLAFLSWTFIRNTPPGYELPPEDRKRALPPGESALKHILQNPFFWMLNALFFTLASPFSVFQGLWGYPFLIDVLKYKEIEASSLIMIIALGAIVGGPLLGYLVDKTPSSRIRLLLTVFTCGQVFNWTCLVFLGRQLGPVFLGGIFFAMGMITSGTLSLIWCIVRESFPPERLGTALALVNASPFLGVAILQPLTGWLMDRVGKTGPAFPFEAYQHAFGLCLSFLCVAFVIALYLQRRRS